MLAGRTPVLIGIGRPNPTPFRSGARARIALGWLSLSLAGGSSSMGCTKSEAPTRDTPPIPEPNSVAPNGLAPNGLATAPENAKTRAQRLSQSLIIVDGHVDLPHRLRVGSEAGRLTEDVSRRTERSH